MTLHSEPLYFIPFLLFHFSEYLAFSVQNAHLLWQCLSTLLLACFASAILLCVEGTNESAGTGPPLEKATNNLSPAQKFLFQHHPLLTSLYLLDSCLDFPRLQDWDIVLASRGRQSVNPL